MRIKGGIGLGCGHAHAREKEDQPEWPNPGKLFKEFAPTLSDCASATDKKRNIASQLGTDFLQLPGRKLKRAKLIDCSEGRRGIRAAPAESATHWNFFQNVDADTPGLRWILTMQDLPGTVYQILGRWNRVHANDLALIARAFGKPQLVGEVEFVKYRFQVVIAIGSLIKNPQIPIHFCGG